MRDEDRYKRTHHFESVEFLLNLLSKHWCESIACCNFTSTIILPTRPGIMKLYSRTECCASFYCCSGSLWGARHTLGIAAEAKSRHEIILTTQGDRACSTVALLLVIGCAWGRRIRRVIDIGNLWQLKVWCLAILRSNDGRRIARVSTRACFLLTYDPKNTELEGTCV